MKSKIPLISCVLIFSLYASPDSDKASEKKDKWLKKMERKGLSCWKGSSPYWEISAGAGLTFAIVKLFLSAKKIRF